MSTATLPQLTSARLNLDMADEKFGLMRSSTTLLGDSGALRSRMQHDGYLYLPGYLDRDEVREARQVMIDRLWEQGVLEQYTLDAVVKKDVAMSFRPDLAINNAPLDRLLYSGRMMAFYEMLLGGPVLHYDFTWLRAVAPGGSTPPHCDVVYMGRGTTNLYTSWTPMGDVPFELGGLMVLEGSNCIDRLRSGYGTKDVDSFCLNRRGEGYTGMGGGGNIRPGGALSNDPVKLRDRLGGRWLTTEYCSGDLLVFSVYTVHASLDNRSDRIRLTTDSRYQLASEPVDERWVGENPIGHGPEAKRGFIC